MVPAIANMEVGSAGARTVVLGIANMEDKSIDAKIAEQVIVVTIG